MTRLQDGRFRIWRDMGGLTDLQREILEAKRDDPSAGPKEIADRVDCSEGYARDHASLAKPKSNICIRNYVQ